MSYETPGLFCRAGSLGCQVDRVLSLSCLHTPSTFHKRSPTRRDILYPVSQIQTEGKGKEGTEIQTTALNIYMVSSERECVYVCVCAVSLSTRMYSFANIYSVFLVRV